MDIFVSWSGSDSKRVAERLKDWLPCVINAVRPWLSSQDIESGTRWSNEIAAKLHSCNFGIICLTSENLHSDWILFEAGALSKNAGLSRTWTLLVDLKPSDVAPPLAQFQHTSAAKSDIHKLLQAINNHLEVNSLSSEQLTKSFEKWWPDLEATLAEQPKKSPASKVRSERELLEEILEAVRLQSRSKVQAGELPLLQGVAQYEREVVKCDFCKLVQFRTESDACRRCGAPLRTGLVVGEIPEQMLMVDRIRAIAKRAGLKRISVQIADDGYIVHGYGDQWGRVEFSIPNDQEMDTLDESVADLIEKLRSNGEGAE